jgi:hypothetical protein
MAAATTNRAATVIMPSLAMPRSASSGSSTPAARSTTTPAIITMSGPRCTKSRSASVAATTVAVSAICQFAAPAWSHAPFMGETVAVRPRRRKARPRRRPAVAR